MSSALTYKGYAARVEFSAEDECLVGHIAGIQDTVGFHAESVPELKHAFEEAVEDYLDSCKKTGKTPQKPYSGKLMLRLKPELHAAIATAAELSGKSINQWAAEALYREADL
ncbi:MAG: type II toxin-antitoxin system HicB family antitoxin [Cellvibrionaceae bacterium]|nr:type II toxin-antitoxin system HicB family antitoxin [Cellvibrionaceae bacterium]MCV6626344.1 type II toxin-antitoxin system HicB family antitoxin [Cellvibrionaceae bacterium]